MVEVVLYGEWEKWVPMSPQRVDNIAVTADNVHVSLRGASNEKVGYVEPLICGSLFFGVNKRKFCH